MRYFELINSYIYQVFYTGVCMYACSSMYSQCLPSQCYSYGRLSSRGGSGGDCPILFSEAENLCKLEYWFCVVQSRDQIHCSLAAGNRQRPPQLSRIFRSRERIWGPNVS